MYIKFTYRQGIPYALSKETLLICLYGNSYILGMCLITLFTCKQTMQFLFFSLIYDCLAFITSITEKNFIENERFLFGITKMKHVEISYFERT